MHQNCLRRTLLFVPGDRPDRIAKAAGLGADIITIDLEDAVPPERKPVARDATRQALREIDFGVRERVVRINAITTLDGISDLLALKYFERLPDAVMLPKVESPGEVQVAGGILSQIGPEIGIIAVLESAHGIQWAREIATASPRMTALLFGGVDFSASVGCQMEWEPLLGARQQTVLAAAAARIDAIDVPFLNLEDLASLEAEARRAARLGFAGKAVIHPKQIESVNRAFSPTQAEIAWARRVLEAAEQAGTGAIRLDGKMIDLAVVKRAQRIAAQAGEIEP